MRLLRNNKNLNLSIQAFCIFLWLGNLTETDSLYTTYLLCGIAGVICLVHNIYSAEEICGLHYNSISIGILSIVFSFLIILANYQYFEIFSEEWGIFACFHIAGAFIGGYFVGYNILLTFVLRVPLETLNSNEQKTHCVFLFYFLVIVFIDILYLWNSAYPGILTRDSFGTINQILSGTYNNTMPYWHTKTVEFFFRLGYKVFNDINAAVATYMVFQILFVAFCMAYALITLYQSNIPKWYVTGVFVLYAMLPYNIIYSVTLWKDVPFGAAACLLITAMYRIIRRIGKSSYLNWILFTVGGICFSLLRTNGWFAFLVVALIMLIFARKRYRMLLWIIAAILIVSWVMLNPYLDAMGVSETDIVEIFSIPLQQIARVVHDDLWIDPTDKELLSQAFDLEIMRDQYNPGISDPIKFQALRRENLSYIKENFWEYVKLWCRLGKQYPGEYSMAWIDQTKGYWNGGHNGGTQYYIYAQGVIENEIGIANVSRQNTISDIFNEYILFLDWNGFTPVLYSIGLNVWLLIACLYLNLAKKRDEFLLTIPSLVLIIGLWFGTPVYAEFRYAYPLMISMPVIVGCTFFSTRIDTKI